MKGKSEMFDFSFQAAEQKDIGKKRSSNQDELVFYPEIGLFAVSDGMGGVNYGGKTAEYVKESIRQMMAICAKDYSKHKNIEEAAKAFKESVQMISDRLFSAGNTETYYQYGATFSGVWLIGNTAVFVNIGDSRGYLLSRFKRKIKQITDDQNIAGILFREGKITKSEMKDNPASSRLTAFVGMKPPAEVEMYITDVKAGDRILICSDGLYGMVEEDSLVNLMRSSKSAEKICEKMIHAANANGGRDNISAVYIKILH